MIAVLAIAPIAALATGGSEPSGDEAGPGEPVAARTAGSRLRDFGSCTALRRYARRHPDAIPYGGGIAGGVVGTPAGPAPGEAGGAQGVSDGSGSTGTPTNVQEAGIDEPDIVKSDGSRIFALAGAELRAVDVGGGGPRELGSLELSELAGNAADGSGHQLLLAGDRLLLITQTTAGATGPAGAEAAFYFSPSTVLSEIDVSDPAAMRVVRTLRVEGAYVNARLAGQTARVVVSSVPDYPIAEPSQSRRRGAKGLLPTTVLRDNATGASEKRRLLPCRDVRRPRRFAGLEMLSVLTIDLARGLEPADVDSIMTHGETVYSSADGLYVATERWVPPDAAERQVSSVTTAVHKFAIDSPTETRYAASGEVDGFMLSQWAMSEQDGLLRVASTAESPNFDFGDRESFVTVLGERGGKLAEVGKVGGLGRGERIYAVRFIGDVAYVVTFRQVDPLYTVDLSLPTDPRVAGELKVPGYSAYLHPVGEDLILGVGQDATDQGRTLGTQVSLFDVADLTAPRALDRQALGEGSSSEVEYDHHAFLHYSPTGLVVIPLEVYGRDGQTFAGAAGFRVGAAGGIEEIARIAHDQAGSGSRDAPLPVRRSLVAGDRLYTLSELGLMQHDLASLAPQSFLPFD